MDHHHFPSFTLCYITAHLRWAPSPSGSRARSLFPPGNTHRKILIKATPGLLLSYTYISSILRAYHKPTPTATATANRYSTDHTDHQHRSYRSPTHYSYTAFTRDLGTRIVPGQVHVGKPPPGAGSQLQTRRRRMLMSAVAHNNPTAILGGAESQHRAAPWLHAQR